MGQEKQEVWEGQDDKKRVKTESGVYIVATYKTNRYSKWKERSKLAQQTEDHE